MPHPEHDETVLFKLGAFDRGELIIDAIVDCSAPASDPSADTADDPSAFSDEVLMEADATGPTGQVRSGQVSLPMMSSRTAAASACPFMAFIT